VRGDGGKARKLFNSKAKIFQNFRDWRGNTRDHKGFQPSILKARPGGLMAAQRRALFVVPVFILGCALAGGLLGSSGQAGAPAAAPSSDSEVNASLESFSKIYDLVEDNNAEKVGPDKGIYKGAIPGMLRTLDPHSNFFDPKDFAGLREEQKGRYFGVGMSIQPQSKTGRTMVLAPFPGSPAYKAGLRPGDVIMAVNDKRADNLTTPEVADLLKGPRGTKVQIVVQREGVEKPLTFNVVRDEVRRDSIDSAFFLKPNIAYIDITQFTETTSEELEADLKKLGEQSLQGLVLDMRGDPGGLLQEAVAVAGRWLRRGQVVVSHKGRAYNEKPYMARGSQYGLNYPIVVLVDRYTASAAEIVSGALQDHDRGWILGDTTFGKGLVQTVFPLSDSTGLALTTQHYYTPSGRLIQRDYSKMSFLDYYYGRRSGDNKDNHDVKQTDLGRVVYGGGGITPDEHFDTPKANPFQISVLRKNAFFTFTAHYFGGKEAKLPKGWAPDETTMNDLHDFLMKNGVQFSEKDWTANHDWLRDRLQQEMYITAFSVDESKKVQVTEDPEVKKAIEALPKAADLLAKMKAHSEVIRASTKK
jgi:carboxyl-terminal processing protease